MLEFKKIRSIKKAKAKTKVYNFSVPNYETYIANGITVHNCQNYKVSQTSEGKSKNRTPEQLVDLAKEKQASGLAFTFNEPTIYYEYIMDVGAIIDLPIVLKTNGFVTIDVLRDLASVVDAFNVDIKGDDEEYERICGGSLSPVIETVDELYSLDKHVEISYLVTPKMLHDDAFHDRMLSWLSKMSDIPIHFLYFYPFHRMTDESYGVLDLLPIIRKFQDKMQYVYVSNVYDSSILKYRNTYCPTCGNLMIDRSRKVRILKGKCCGNFVAGSSS